ncbi:MAG: hypothetical protein ACTSWX_05875 [Promethearchaeota archaeon]
MSEIKSNILWLFIKNGKPHPLGLNSINKYNDVLSPLIETKFTINSSKTWDITNKSKDDIIKSVLNYYHNLIIEKKYYPGQYGDWIKCTELKINEKKFLNLDIIGQSSWLKATMAADLGIFVKNNEKIFFVGIVRKNTPGKGKPALIGGIMNVGSVLDSPAYTILKETKEEANFTMNYQGNLKKLRVNYTISRISIKIKGFEVINQNLRSLKTYMYYVTTIPTTKQENLGDGTKRVYTATAFTVLIDIEGNSLNKKQLQKVFEAGDDAAKMYYLDVTDFIHGKDMKNHPNFGLKHHLGLFKKMVLLLKKKYDL